MRVTAVARLGSVTIAGVVLLAAGCGGLQPSGPGPSMSGPTSAATASSDGGSPIPEPRSDLIDQLVGPWREDPIELDDTRTAIVSDACAAAALAQLGQAESDLPTALVDARGEGFATAILADDLLAIECLARTDGRTATVDSVARLSPTRTALIDGPKATLARLVEEEDRDGGRTVAFGRFGPEATGVSLGFRDGSEVVASTDLGWWGAWWPAAVRPVTIAAVDGSGTAVGGVTVPPGEIEARVGPASWWLDPKALAPTPNATSIAALVLEESCASGTTAEGRVELPAIEVTETSVIVTFSVRQQPGGQDCQGNPPTPFVFELPEPLGNRTLYDGGDEPPRRAGEPPAG